METKHQYQVTDYAGAARSDTERFGRYFHNMLGLLTEMIGNGLFLGRGTAPAASFAFRPETHAPEVRLAPRLTFALEADSDTTIRLTYGAGYRLLSGTLPGSMAPIRSGTNILPLTGL